MSKVLRGQSLLDIVCQETSSLASVMSVAVNNGVSITDDLEVSSTIAVAPGEPMRRKPATAIRVNIHEETSLQGIGYWSVNGTFKVS